MTAETSPMRSSPSSGRLTTVGHRKLNTVSTVLAWICTVLALVLPLAVLAGVASWIFGYASPPGGPLPQALFSSQTSTGLQMIAGLLLLLPVAATSYSLWRARSCFQRFGRGEYFAPATVSGLRGFAAGMAAAQLLGILVQPTVGLLMMWAGPRIKGAVTLDLNAQHLLFFLFAGMVWVIAEVMTRAVTLAEENAQFV